MRRPSVAVAVLAMIGGTLVVTAGPTEAVVAGPPVCTAGPAAGTTTSGAQQWVVVDSDTATVTIPVGVTSVFVDACAAKGGMSTMAGGLGAHVTSTVSVTGGATYLVVAGTAGDDASPGTASGGYLGGGDGAPGGGGGGGLSGFFSGTTPTRASALVVAGGGGGGSFTVAGAAGGTGGSTGTLDGQDATDPAGAGGGGGGYSGGAAAFQPCTTPVPGGPCIPDPGPQTAAQGGANLGTSAGTNPNPDGVVVISYTLPSSTVTTQASPPVGAGQTISDTATVTSVGPTPTGTVTFKLYGPNDSTCGGAPVQTDPQPLVSGSAESTPYSGVAGVYRYVADYSGDANHAPASSACNDPNETTSIGLAVTGLVTNATPASAQIGSSVSDSATVTMGLAPTGTVTFRLFGPNDSACSTTPVYSATSPVTNGDASSGSYKPATAGTYRWTASYSGDANNAPSESACNATNESNEITKATPVITTQATSSITIGNTISDSATVTMGSPPITGTVTFRLYGPADTTCTAAPVFTSSGNPVTNGDAQSAPYTPPSAGIYRWRATYDGNANNNVVTGACNAAGENSVVNPKLVPTLTTQATSAAFGGSISDSATVTGAGAPPTGTVTFNLYDVGDSTCAGAPISSSTKPLVGGTASSDPFTATSAGDYRWRATYNGDATYATASGACNAAGETSTVTASTGGGGGGGAGGGTSPTPSPTTSPSASPTPSASASPTRSASPSTSPARGALTLTTDTPDIKPGQEGRLHATGTTSQEVQLFCYSRPSTTYVQVRPTEPGQGIAISNGAVDFTIFPGRNTRCFVQYLNSPSTASDSVVINVHTALSLSAYRDGVRRYHFQGTNLPRRAGQLITLYRYARKDTNGYCDPHAAPGDFTGASTNPNCVAIRTAIAYTNSSNVWRIDRTFTGSGQFIFAVRTSQTLTNAAGVSNFRLTIIH